MTPGQSGAGEFEPGAVWLSVDSRPLRRSLRPLAWVILEEVALDAVVEDGRLVARTSGRRVAEHLGINPGTAAETLRLLARRGLVRLEREKGPAGRFGLSVYQLAPVAGMCVVRPCTADPSMAPPHMAAPSNPGPASAAQHMNASHTETSRPDSADSNPGEHGRPERATTEPDSRDAINEKGSRRTSGGSPVTSGRPDPALQCAGQESLDLGLGAS